MLHCYTLDLMNSYRDKTKRFNLELQDRPKLIEMSYIYYKFDDLNIVPPAPSNWKTSDPALDALKTFPY